MTGDVGVGRDQQPAGRTEGRPGHGGAGRRGVDDHQVVLPRHGGQRPGQQILHTVIMASLTTFLSLGEEVVGELVDEGAAGDEV